jgi:hypothetical protein
MLHLRGGEVKVIKLNTIIDNIHICIFSNVQQKLRRRREERKSED